MRNYKLLIPLFVAFSTMYTFANQVSKPESLPYKLEKVMHEKDLTVNDIVAMIENKLNALKRTKRNKKVESDVVCMVFLYVAKS